MSKYVIELDEDVKILQSISVTPNGNAYTNTQWQANLEELTTDYINEHYPTILQDAYDRGYKDGRNVTETQAHDDAYHKGLAEGNDIGFKNGVKDGQNEVWNCAKRLCLHPYNGGMTGTEISAVFGEASATQVLYKCSAQQAIEKLKAYEKKQADKIEVRDEVVWTVHEDVVIVVTRIYTINKMEWCDGFGKDGKVYSILTENARKTGRQFDISKILEAMKHD